MLARRQAHCVIGVAVVACVALRPDGRAGVDRSADRHRLGELTRLKLRGHHLYGPGFGPEGSNSCRRRRATTAASSTGSTCRGSGSIALTGSARCRRRLRPGALALGPTGRNLYLSLDAEGRVAKVDVWRGTVCAKVATGSAPRNLAIAPDGRALQVVDYQSDTITKLRTSDLSTLQTVAACFHSIGITYDRATRRLWVACYTR
jgi:hypothetical protein